jgi:TolB-like protein
MFTDMVGYTALGQRNEALSLALVEEQRKLVRPVLGKHNGREVKTMGDAFLVEFPNALDAVRCGYDVQRAVREFNVSLPEERRVHLRVGIHLGDIVESEGDISGDAVNVASRIEALAEDGGVCMTRQVYDQVANKFDVPMKSLGVKSLKNVTMPLEVYQLVMPWRSQTPGTEVEIAKGRIAVLPFANMSPDSKDEYFADGMTDELITALSRIIGLRVIARTSVMRYKGERVPINQIGKDLKVGSLIEGSVRKYNQKVRITVKLVETESEEHLWEESYDRDFADIFSIQTDIAGQVARALELKFVVGEGPPPLAEANMNTEALALYIKGRQLWNNRSELDLNRAIKYFEEALGRDPGCAPAYGGLADCYSILGYYCFRRPNVAYPIAMQFAEKALSLDGGLAEAHASVGEMLMQYYFDWDKSAIELDKALELNPSYATAHMWRGTHHMVNGRFKEALLHVRKAVELDPLSMILLTDEAKDLYYARRFEEAADRYRQSMKIDPDFPIAHKGLAETYAQEGMFDEAIVEAKKAIELSSGSVFILDDLGYIYAKAGMAPEARKILVGLDRIGEEQYVPAYGRAAIHAALGEDDLALQWVEKSFEERAFTIYLNVDPAFDSLRRTDRFVAILRKTGQ